MTDEDPRIVAIRDRLLAHDRDREKRRAEAKQAQDEADRKFIEEFGLEAYFKELRDRNAE